MAWLTGWTYRKAITITDQTGQSWTDAQVQIDLTDYDLPLAQSSGIDIRFTDSDGTTLLSYWREAFDGNTAGQTKLFWVKVPSIPANGSTTIYVYWGNSSATDVSSTTDTFIDDIDGLIAAYHFDEGSGTTTEDSSGSGYDLNLINGPTWVSGRFNNALNFDGSDDYLQSTSYFSTPAQMTVIAYVNLTDVSIHRRVINHHSSTDYGWFVSIYETDGVVEVGSSQDGTSFSTFTGNTNVADGTWHMIGARWDGTNRYIIVDGAIDNTDSWPYSLHSPANKELLIGTNMTIGNYFFKGDIDEVFIFNKALTDQQISDLYNNYGYTSSYYSGHLLIRQWIDPAPSISIGSSEAYQELSLSTTVTASLSGKRVVRKELAVSTALTPSLGRKEALTRTLEVSPIATISLDRLFNALRELSISIAPSAEVAAHLVIKKSLAVSTTPSISLERTLTAIRELAVSTTLTPSVTAKKVVKICGLPDFTVPIAIRAQLIDTIGVDIRAQSIGTLDVNLKVADATVNVNIANAPTLNVVVTNTQAIDVNITNSVALDVYVKNTEAILVDINNAPTLNVVVTNTQAIDVNITNSTDLNVYVKNTDAIKVDITNATTLDVNILGGTTNIVFNDQTAPVYNQAQYLTKTGSHILKTGISNISAGSWAALASYDIPSDKDAYIYDFGVAVLDSGTDLAVAAILRENSAVHLAYVGGKFGASHTFGAPIRVSGGNSIDVYVKNPNTDTKQFSAFIHMVLESH